MDFSVDDFNFASLKKKSASGSGSGLKNLSKRLKRGYGYSQKIPPRSLPTKKSISLPPVFLLHRLVLCEPFPFFFFFEPSHVVIFRHLPAGPPRGGSFYGRGRFQKKQRIPPLTERIIPGRVSGDGITPHENVSHLWKGHLVSKESHNLRYESLRDLRILSPFG